MTLSDLIAMLQLLGAISDGNIQRMYFDIADMLINWEHDRMTGNVISTD